MRSRSAASRDPASLARAAASLVLAAACGCASVGSGMRSSVSLGPGERAAGYFKVPAAAAARMRIENLGPGHATFVMRLGTGVPLQSGSLDTAAEVGFTPSAAVVLVVAVEAAADAGTTVAFEMQGALPGGVTWDRPRADR